MKAWRIFLQFLLTEQCLGSVNVGANVGISNLFNPSAEAPYVLNSFPYPGYLEDYRYHQYQPSYDNLEVADTTNFDTLAEEYIYNNEIDRQVGEPFIVEEDIIGPPSLDGLTPLLVTSALFVGLSALFSNVVNLNSTASNATVPFGLWALPTLADLPLLSDITPNITASGRRKRSLEDNDLDDGGEDGVDMLEDSLTEYLFTHDQDTIVSQVRQALRSIVLIDSNQECQAAFGCRFGQQYLRSGNSMSSETMSMILRHISPLGWDVFTEVFTDIVNNPAMERNCSVFNCSQCLSLK